MVPLGLALLVLKGIGPMIGWRRSTPEGLRHQFLIPVLVALVTAGGLAALGVREALPLATFAGCGFVLATIVLEIARGVRVRQRSTGGDPLSALGGLFSRNRRRYGGYLVHAGVALMFIGFGGEAYKLEAEIQLSRGQRTAIGHYTLRHDGIEVTRDDQKEMTTATLSVFRDGKRLGTVHPARWQYFKHEGQPTSEVDIRRGLREDLFVVLGSFEPKSDLATFKMIVNPLVNWIWIGFVLLSLGTAIALVPRRLQRALGAVRVSSLLVVLGLAAALGALAPAEAWAAPEAKRAHTPEEKTSPVKIVSEAERRLFSRIACMCPTCPRIPLADCQCGFAGTEREAIRAKLGAGWDEEKILRWYLEARGRELSREPFGAAALTTPPDTTWNRLSWLLPYGASVIAIVVLFLVGRRWVRSGRSAGAPAAGGERAAEPPLQSDYEKLLDRELKKMD